MNTPHAPHTQDAPSTETTTPTPVTIAYGDGIGPEIMEATLRILDAARAPLSYDVIEVGQSVYERGHTSGIAPEAWQTIRRNRVFLKAPITTPQGGGYKSLNVTIRKTLNLYANVRPSKSYAPFVSSLHPGMDLVIIRENEEDLYAGIEHQQTPEVAQILKLITRPGSERIIRYAFEYARAYGRRKVTCMTKDNIMKITDGLFHRVFDEVAADYPDLEAEHQIIDIGAARVAAQPEQFDVIVTLNLYGDILSDIAAQIAGSVGLAGSANIGDTVAMFEAVHGSAPDIAGKDVANPSGLLVAATQMLVHLGPGRGGRAHQERLAAHPGRRHPHGGHLPAGPEQPRGGHAAVHAGRHRPPRRAAAPAETRSVPRRRHPRRGPVPSPPAEDARGRRCVHRLGRGGRDPNVIGERLEAAAGTVGWRLKMITNRGVKVYPEGLPETFCTDHWRCRFLPAHDGPATFPDVLALLKALHEAGFEVIKTEHLYTFDGERGYSLGQGE
ncbi:MAG: hypothetical protein KatS3mg042_1144 [Rhodothermaceae bacterium]|nr:MAG: hypothetical protein KatS3mg042_1144 [Rhodothermaceae bacterium]